MIYHYAIDLLFVYLVKRDSFNAEDTNRGWESTDYLFTKVDSFLSWIFASLGFFFISTANSIFYNLEKGTYIKIVPMKPKKKLKAHIAI